MSMATRFRNMLNSLFPEYVVSDVLTVTGGVTRAWEYKRYAVATRSFRGQGWDVDLVENSRRKQIGSNLPSQEVVAMFVDRVNTYKYMPHVPWRFINGKKNPLYTGALTDEVTRIFEPGQSDCAMSNAWISLSVAQEKSFREHSEF